VSARAEECCVLLPAHEIRASAVRARIVVVGVTCIGFEEAAYHTVLDGVAAVMQERRPGNCMMWNLGWRMEILGRMLQGRVLEFGGLCTTCNLQPLWQIVNIVHSIRSWLRESDDRTAFVHCLHPQRLLVFLRCLLAPPGPCQLSSADVDKICAQAVQHSPPGGFTLPPSHERYLRCQSSLACPTLARPPARTHADCATCRVAQPGGILLADYASVQVLLAVGSRRALPAAAATAPDEAAAQRHPRRVLRRQRDRAPHSALQHAPSGLLHHIPAGRG
jgi:hypothetical protein